MPSVRRFDSVANLRSLMRAEYREMPGLCLTLPQAARLWAADREACARALDMLVESGFLSRCGAMYMRADTGRRCA